MLRRLFGGLFNRCAVCGEACEPEMLRNMGKYYICTDCLRQEEKLRKKKIRAKARTKKEERQEKEQENQDVETFNQQTLMEEANAIFDN